VKKINKILRAEIGRGQARSRPFVYTHIAAVFLIDADRYFAGEIVSGDLRVQRLKNSANEKICFMVCLLGLLTSASDKGVTKTKQQSVKQKVRN